MADGLRGQRRTAAGTVLALINTQHEPTLMIVGASLRAFAGPVPGEIRKAVLTKKDDDQVARLERARQIGLFRYMLIREAADPSLTSRQRGALVRAIAGVPHTDPDGRTIWITRWTLDRWISDWRKGGFDALVPSPRQAQPRTPPEVFELATALKKENPARTAAQIRRILVIQHGWAPDERTLQRMFVRTGLTALRAPVEPAVFGRFEAERPNEIWTGDALHGPRIGGRKTYLFAFIDDHSRAIVGHRWGFAEDTVRLAAALRPALASRWPRAASPSTSMSTTARRSSTPG